MKRILIAGTHSGCGKTTLTCALLSALKRRGLRVAAFKCGPDYIDPMFHREAIGVPSRNLDPFFCTPAQLRAQLDTDADVAVLEGVMGYYDGVGADGHCSTYDVAKSTDTPTVLVVHARGACTSLGAVIRGFKAYRDPSHIVGVIFNNATEATYPMLKTVAEKEGVAPLGFLPSIKDFAIESRHLGLKTPHEIEDIQSKLAKLGELAEKRIDIETLLELSAESASNDKNARGPQPSRGKPKRCRVAVARDKAFCFLYPENIELLEEAGAEIAYFSPLSDRALPPAVNGLYLCGGYPELYPEELSANRSMRASIRQAIDAGLPTIAECGGFLYLHRTIDAVPTVGVIDGDAFKTERLQHFGYVLLTAERDNLLCRKGEQIRSHEFHYYTGTANGADFTAQKPFGERSWPCVHASETLWAGFPHLYFPANPVFAENFMRKCESYEH
jgi:cobyrinic acid a,c-diamide synthase